jgi:hypothetical protein
MVLMSGAVGVVSMAVAAALLRSATAQVSAVLAHKGSLSSPTRRRRKRQ